MFTSIAFVTTAIITFVVGVAVGIYIACKVVAKHITG